MVPRRSTQVARSRASGQTAQPQGRIAHVLFFEAVTSTRVCNVDSALQEAKKGTKFVELPYVVKVAPPAGLFRFMLLLCYPLSRHSSGFGFRLFNRLV